MVRMTGQNEAAVELNRLRWQGMSREERRAATEPARTALAEKRRQEQKENDSEQV